MIPFLGDFISPFIAASLEPSIYNARGSAWYRGPNLVLQPDKLTKLFKTLTGLTTVNYTEAMRWHGIDVSGIGGRNFLKLCEKAHPRSTSVRYNATGDGLPHGLWEWMLKYDKNILTNDEILTLVNRRMMTPQLAKFLLSLNLDGETDLADVYYGLRLQIPPYTDLIRFSVKEAYNTAIITKYGYNKELPTESYKWMDMQGLGGSLDFNIPPGSTDVDGNPIAIRPATWMDMIWFSHWDSPSKTEGFDMLHRFYKESRFGASPEWNREVETDESVVADLLKIQDYPEFWRKRLVALSYKPLTRIDTKRMYSIGILDDAGAYHSFRAQGYNDQNAWDLVTFIKKEKENRENATKQKIKKKIIEGRKIGLTTDEQFKAALERIDVPENERNFLSSDLNMEKQLAEIKNTLRYAKVAYLDGLINATQVEQLLGSSLQDNAEVQRYLRMWTMQGTLKKRYLSAEKALELYINRIVSRDEVIRKLINLNFTSNEVSLMVLEADRKIASNVAKEQQKVLKEQQKVAIQRQRNVVQATNKVLSAFTQKNITNWFKAGILTLPVVVQILRQKGWNRNAIVAFLVSDLQLGQSQAEEEVPNEQVETT